MTSDLIVLGTDTGVGKTTFSMLWLAAFSDEFEYWKPVETGDSDSDQVRRLVPIATIHPPLARFRDPVSPPLAARREGRAVASAAELAAARPRPLKWASRLLVETFGSPLSPLNDHELQARAVQLLGLPSVLVVSSTVGAIGRALQSLLALAAWNIAPVAVVLVGPRDEYALKEIRKHAESIDVFALESPESFDVAGIVRSADQQRGTLDAIHRAVCLRMSTGDSDPTSLIERDRMAVWHPYSPLRDPDPPLAVASAQDEFLILQDGRRVIDAISSWWTILHGHRHPVLMRALAEAARQFDHVFFAGVTHPSAVELAELMLSTMPWPGGRVFYSDDGSTAVEVAIKMAYQFWCHRGEPHRTMFVGFDDGYHGDTFGAMSVGRDPTFFGRFEPLLFRAERVPVSAERLDAVLTQHAGHVAAVIIEPLVQGAGGMRMHAPEELRAIFQVVRQHGVLFIVDEVMTGGGRTGSLWAYQTAGIAPDLICAGKTIAGGVLPIAATIVAPQIVAAFDSDDRARTFFHGHSFTAHPLACAVGVANWRLLANGVGPAPARIERFWTERLAGLLGDHRVTDVRVRGTIAAVELDFPGGYLADVARTMRRVSLEHGVLLRPLGNVIYAMPPYCTSDDSLAKIAGAIEAAVTAVW
jgi:adenosylmethionine-8-amino-7-oxononanoate aminotransferase